VVLLGRDLGHVYCVGRWLLGGLAMGLCRTSVVSFAPLAVFVAASTIAIVGHPTLGDLGLALSLPQVG
jgi:hypothetical protein